MAELPSLQGFPAEVWEVLFEHLPWDSAYSCIFISQTMYPCLQRLFLMCKSPFKITFKSLCSDSVAKWLERSRTVIDAGGKPFILDFSLESCCNAVSVLNKVHDMVTAGLEPTSLKLCLPREHHFDDGGRQWCARLGHCFQHLSSLQTLILHCVDERNLDAQSLESLSCLRGLVALDLNDGYLPTGRCITLIHSIAQLPDLKTMDLGHNHIGDQGCREWSKLEMLFSEKLRTLKLNYCDVGVEGCRAFALCVLTKFLNLTSLNFNGNNIGDSGATMLAESLTNLSSLESLLLNNVSMGSSGCKAFSKAMEYLPQLHSLNLGSNRIEARGCKALSKGMQHMTNLQSLDLGWCEIGGAGTNILSTGLSCLTSLQTLNLRSNVVSNAGCEGLGNGIVSLVKLRSLSLYRNNITAKGCERLCTALGHLLGLEALDIGNNKLGSSGSAIIAGVVSQLTRLRSLGIADTFDGGRGLIEIWAPALTVLSDLHSLDLSYNKVQDRDCSHLAFIFRNLPSIEVIELGNNLITEVGCRTLAGSLAHAVALAPAVAQRNASWSLEKTCCRMNSCLP